MNLERTKTFLIFLREAPKTAAWYGLGLICVSFAIFILVLAGLAVWHLPSVANSYAHAMEAQAKQIEQNTITTDVGEGVRTLMTKLNTGADEFIEGSRAFKDASVALGPQLQSITDNANEGFDEVTGLVADARRDSLPAFNASLASVTSVIDEARPNIVGASEQLKTGMTSLADAARVIDESIKDPKVKTFVDEAMARGKSILINLDTATSDVTFITADGRKVTTHAIGISANFEAMTLDSRNKLHDVLYPAKAKGFWPRTGQILRYIWEPVSEGLGIYYRLRTLPIRITEPIPLFK